MCWNDLFTAGVSTKRLRRHGAQLLDQQMWCWGRDIVRPEGNLLCAYGFSRYRYAKQFSSDGYMYLDGNPKHKVATSGYTFIRNDGVWIGLWGWGMLYGNSQEGTVFLHRFDFTPIWINITSVPQNLRGPDDLHTFRVGKARDLSVILPRLFTAALNWAASYERWVLDVAGLDYRSACVAQWPKAVVPASDMAMAWSYLAKHGHTLL
ncbi:MAG: hypothetical protein KatS3mg106_053 [Gemmataceae bacterium]|nr:MAG: hypothetical protein KatS3mg106_053 [Gemmataceae bacterium]